MGGQRMQPGAFLGEHVHRGPPRHPVHPGVDLGAEHPARRLQLGERGVLAQQVGVLGPSPGSFPWPLSIPAIPATPTVTLPARDPDVVHEMTLAAGPLVPVRRPTGGGGSGVDQGGEDHGVGFVVLGFFVEGSPAGDQT